MQAIPFNSVLIGATYRRTRFHGHIVLWMIAGLITALLINATTCRMGYPHPMLAGNADTQAVQATDVGEPLPSSPTAPLSGERMTHHSQCVVALLVLNLLANPLVRSVSIAVPPVMRRSQRTTAPLLPPP